MRETTLEGAEILVTGGAGFIGSHLTVALVARGARVRVLDDLSTGRLSNLEAVAGRIEWLEGDLRDAETCRRAVEGVELVFHQAALGSVPRSLERPSDSFAVNTQGTVELLDAARRIGARRFVFASSSSVYGSSERLPKREGEEGEPLSPYAASKLFQEQLARVFQTCYGLEAIGLRYFNVYGPRQRPDGPYAAVVPRFFAAALDGEALEIFGNGEQSRDFTYVADVVEANIAAALAPTGACGASYNVAAGRRVTVNELANAILGLVDGDSEIVRLPPRPGDVRHSLADLELVAERLRYRPRWTLERGLAATLAHFRLTADRLPATVLEPAP